MQSAVDPYIMRKVDGEWVHIIHIYIDDLLPFDFEQGQELMKILLNHKFNWTMMEMSHLFMWTGHAPNLIKADMNFIVKKIIIKSYYIWYQRYF